MCPAQAAPKVTVNEWAWDIVEEPGDGRMLIRYNREAPVYIAEREEGDPVRWRLTRRDLWPRPTDG